MTAVEQEQELAPADIELDDGKTIHLWWRRDHALCGAMTANHTCYHNPAYYWAESGQSHCPGCGKPMCQFCMGLEMIRRGLL